MVRFHLHDRIAPGEQVDEWPGFGLRGRQEAACGGALCILTTIKSLSGRGVWLWSCPVLQDGITEGNWGKKAPDPSHTLLKPHVDLQLSQNKNLFKNIDNLFKTSGPFPIFLLTLLTTALRTHSCSSFGPQIPQPEAWPPTDMGSLHPVPAVTGPICIHKSLEGRVSA